MPKYKSEPDIATLRTYYLVLPMVSGWTYCILEVTDIVYVETNVDAIIFKKMYPDGEVYEGSMTWILFSDNIDSGHYTPITKEEFQECLT